MNVIESGDLDRFVPESPKSDAVDVRRGAFQRDRARVLHSAGFRRLAAKTQVHSASNDAFLRTRLTHSLEVAQIGREMGARLGCDPDLVDVAGLAHDLGHPPFGHNGEDALNEVAADCGGFEGNAQTLRVLTRLEAKVLDSDGRSAGLNLTRAALDAVSKYPWYRRPGSRKFGAYADDAPVFSWLRKGVDGDRRCLEAQVMDWSDDVSYSEHDHEDGIHGGFNPQAQLRRDPDERAALCADVALAYSHQSTGDLAPILDELLADPVFTTLDGYDGSHGAQVALKRLTSVLTGRFAVGALQATRAVHGDEPLSRYDADLVVPAVVRAQCALLKGIALRYVMRRPGSEERYAREVTVLRELVAALLRRAPEALDPVFAPLWRDAPDDAARLRVVIDQVASLTDHLAVAWHKKLSD